MVQSNNTSGLPLWHADLTTATKSNNNIIFLFKTGKDKNNGSRRRKQPQNNRPPLGLITMAAILVVKP
jgi:hypothetical protein